MDVWSLVGKLTAKAQKSTKFYLHIFLKKHVLLWFCYYAFVCLDVGINKMPPSIFFSPFTVLLNQPINIPPSNVSVLWWKCFMNVLVLLWLNYLRVLSPEPLWSPRGWSEASSWWWSWCWAWRCLCAGRTLRRREPSAASWRQRWEGSVLKTCHKKGQGSCL